ncbi:hypothetical protein NIES2134_118160 [Thermostichus vulcanus NIES-2134]|nr:hypothetical protein NIES2134_118160 [Thermostichus vulcanus NIES-2134]
MEVLTGKAGEVFTLLFLLPPLRSMLLLKVASLLNIGLGIEIALGIAPLHGRFNPP